MHDCKYYTLAAVKPYGTSSTASLDFKKPVQAMPWKRRLYQFHTASNLTEATSVKRSSTLLYYLGVEAKAVLDSSRACNKQGKEAV